MNAVTRHEGEHEPFVHLPVVTPMTMIERAIEKGADVAMIEKLMELQERNDRNIGRRAFDQAMAKAKAEIPAIRKNRKVKYDSGKGKVDYSHEDLAEIARTVDPILSRYGLSYRFRTTQGPSWYHRDLHRLARGRICRGDDADRRGRQQRQQEQHPDCRQRPDISPEVYPQGGFGSGGGDR